MRLCLLAVLAAAAVTPVHADDWLPVTPDELTMKSEPKAPAAPAVYLYREVDRDDNAPDEVIYERIKVLTEEGRKYGNVEITYDQGNEFIRNVRARTIRPDGTVIPFDGTVYEKPIVKSRGVKVMAKAFTLPNVEVGSILEYRYRHTMSSGYVYNSRWLLSQNLFTRHAKFSLKPSRDFALRWSWPLGLPTGTQPPKREAGVIRLETRDVPAFVTEDYMPPEDLMKYRVDFIYDDDTMSVDPVKFWKAYGKSEHRRIESFANDRRVMEQAVAEIVQAGDAPEDKVQKIYRRVQQIRNLSFERDKSEQETKRENLAEARDAGDVWKRGYGDGVQITWLFLGLVRAAGIEADAVLVPTRDRYFFDKRLMSAWQLNSNAVVVKLPTREMFLDPGTPFTPFGLLPWSETGVSALRLNKSGSEFVTTPQSPAASSRVERKAALLLTPEGSLEGKVTVIYTGLEGAWRRLAQRNEDDTERREFLEDDLEEDVPSGVDVKLVNTPDWKDSDAPLVAEFTLRVPGWAARAGKRFLLPVGVFGRSEQHAFEHAARVHPLYFRFPFQHVDEVTIELPAGWQASSIPKARSADLKVASYSMVSEDAQTSLRLKRDLMLNFIFADVKYYPQFRGLFQTVRAGDGDQIVVTPSATSASR